MSSKIASSKAMSSKAAPPKPAPPEAAPPKVASAGVGSGQPDLARSLAEPATEQTVAPPLTIAPIWRRVAARATDLVVVFFIQFMLVVVQIFWFMDDVSQRYDFEPWGRSFMASMIFIGLYGIYEIFFHTFAGGQTPGKILLEIEVVRHQDARTPSLLQSLVRWPLAGIALPLLFAPNSELWFAHYKLWALALWLAPGVTAVFTKDRFSLHDLVAGTQVVRHVQTEEETQQIEDMKSRRKELREKYGLGLFNKLR